MQKCRGAHMEPKKLAFSDEVILVIKQLSKVVFSVTSKEQIENLFGLTNEQLKMVMRKIVNALPNIYFEKKYQNKLGELKTIIAREFIFFQVQEKWNDPNYQNHLANFIRIFSRDIEREF